MRLNTELTMRLFRQQRASEAAARGAASEDATQPLTGRAKQKMAGRQTPAALEPVLSDIESIIDGFVCTCYRFMCVRPVTCAEIGTSCAVAAVMNLNMCRSVRCGDATTPAQTTHDNHYNLNLIT